MTFITISITYNIYTLVRIIIMTLFVDIMFSFVDITSHNTHSISLELLLLYNIYTAKYYT